MDFNLTVEQQLLGDTVQRFLAKEYGFEARRKIVKSEAGWSRDSWAKLAEMWLLALQVPEQHGGMAAATGHPVVVHRPVVICYFGYTSLYGQFAGAVCLGWRFGGVAVYRYYECRRQAGT